VVSLDVQLINDHEPYRGKLPILREVEKEFSGGSESTRATERQNLSKQRRCLENYGRLSPLGRGQDLENSRPRVLQGVHRNER
jgi:hypothetical protein